MAYLNSDVAHEFAHKTGNKQNGSNFYYRENGNGIWTIYSYGSHFAICSLFENTAIFTERSYSNSTAKHISLTSRAVSHYDIINVPENSDNYFYWDSETGRQEIGINKHKAQRDFKTWTDRIETFVGKQQRARKRDYTSDIINIVENAKKYAEFFNVKHYLIGGLRKVIFEDFTEEEIINYYLGEDFTQELETRRQRQRQRKAQQIRKAVKKFKAGDIDSISLSVVNGTYLRLGKKEHNGTLERVIQTSKGITIWPGEFGLAKKLYICAKRAKEAGKELTDCFEGYRLAGYRITRITDNGTIKAGCHVVPFSESQEIAKKLGWD